MESYYDISYLTVSYSFLFGFIGYLIAAFCCDIVHRLIGRWGVITLGGILQLTCFLLAYLKPPFELFVMAYFISGFGNGLVEATINVWAGNLNNNNELLGLAHGFYAIGGIVSPSLATTLLMKGYGWNTAYCPLAFFTVISTLVSFYAFRDETAAVYRKLMDDSSKQHVESPTHNHPGSLDESTQLLAQGGLSSHSHNAQHHHDPNNVLAEIDPAAAIGNFERVIEQGDEAGALKQALTSKLVWLVSFALLVYCGEEVGMGGWITTFMIDERHGDENTMGYVSTAYWVGMAVGRMGLGFVNGRVNVKTEYFSFVYIILSLAALLALWVVPDITVSSVCAPLIGFFTAPLYPSAMIIFLEKFPEHLHVVGVGILAAAGGIGSALGPFFIGVLTSSYGAWTLAPVGFFSIAAMFVAWIFMVWEF